MNPVFETSTTTENIDARIEQWHDSDSPLKLHEYLGLSWIEYSEWVMKGNLIQRVPNDTPYVTPNPPPTLEQAREQVRKSLEGK